MCFTRIMTFSQNARTTCSVILLAESPFIKGVFEGWYDARTDEVSLSERFPGTLKDNIRIC